MKYHLLGITWLSVMNSVQLQLFLPMLGLLKTGLSNTNSGSRGLTVPHLNQLSLIVSEDSYYHQLCVLDESIKVQCMFQIPWSYSCHWFSSLALKTKQTT